MQTFPESSYGPIPINEYLEAFERSLRRSLGHRRSFDVDDMVQAELMRVYIDFDRISAKYADPVTYGRIRSKAALVDHLRKDNAQRGAGSRFSKGDDGEVVRGRKIVHLDAPITNRASQQVGSVADQVAGNEEDFVTRLVDRLWATGCAGALTEWLAPEQYELLDRAFGGELTDTELGLQYGITRESANRRKRAVLQRAAELWKRAA